jgi:hypothetical protein
MPPGLLLAIDWSVPRPSARRIRSISPQAICLRLTQPLRVRPSSATSTLATTLPPVLRPDPATLPGRRPGASATDGSTPSGNGTSRLSASPVVSPSTGTVAAVFERRPRGAAYHKRQHHIMRALTAVGVGTSALGFAARDGGVAGTGITMVVFGALAGFHRHDWEHLDRNLEKWRQTHRQPPKGRRRPVTKSRRRGT